MKNNFNWCVWMKEDIAIIDLIRKSFSNDKMSMYYHGNFDDSFTEQLIALADSEVEKKAKKRIALLVSESFQNLVRHSDSELDAEKNSLFGIRNVGPFIHIFSSNSVTGSTKDFLEDKLYQLNQMDKDQIKHFYADALQSGILSSKGGAGLGLIEMARKSERPIQKSFTKTGNNLYDFNMQVDLLIVEQVDGLQEPSPILVQENEVIHNLIVDHTIVFLYKGDFSAESMNPILSIMQQNVTENGDSMGFKIFHTAVELMQNIVRHGKEIAGKKEGVFCLNKTKNGYYISTGNYVNHDVSNFLRFIEDINSKQKPALDDMYRSALKKSAFSEGSSAGIGLIDLRRSMMTTLDVKIDCEKDEMYIMIGIEIPLN